MFWTSLTAVVGIRLTCYHLRLPWHRLKYIFDSNPELLEQPGALPLSHHILPSEPPPPSHPTQWAPATPTSHNWFIYTEKKILIFLLQKSKLGIFFLGAFSKQPTPALIGRYQDNFTIHGRGSTLKHAAYEMSSKWYVIKINVWFPCYCPFNDGVLEGVYAAGCKKRSCQSVVLKILEAAPLPDCFLYREYCLSGTSALFYRVSFLVGRECQSGGLCLHLASTVYPPGGERSIVATFFKLC
jgi:hypothetical protein